MKTSAMHTIPLPAGTGLEQGSMMLVNPFTALALIHMAEKGRHRAVVNNAAASSLGKMLIRMARLRSIPLINIVRKAEHIPLLQAEGAEHVLNSSHPDFEKELKELARELGATLFLDAVSGEESKRLLAAAPDGSTLVTYARLSGQILQADPADLIKHGKEITGFQLGFWLRQLPIPARLRFARQVRKHLPGALTSEIRATYPLKEVETAISSYRQNMSAGKTLLVTETQSKSM
jgi:NADPH:quinone reductase-like Zn-dependent oxidoreductase